MSIQIRIGTISSSKSTTVDLLVFFVSISKSPDHSSLNFAALVHFHFVAQNVTQISANQLIYIIIHVYIHVYIIHVYIINTCS